VGNDKAIVVTGTSTGIGKACALSLDRLGYKIHAGVRKQAQCNNLKKEASSGHTSIILDVTDTDSISSAVRIIDKEIGGNLFGLINNAGIGRGGALEVTPVTEMRKLMDVNVICLMVVTQSFIPMLRTTKGRIINIGSTSGYLALPDGSLYSASKFAVRAITDSLRLELKPFDISVSLISPGAIESVIWEKEREYKDKLRKTINPDIAELYTQLRKFGDRLNREVKKIPAIEVVKVAANALKMDKPKRYYFIGNDVKGAEKISKMP
jgi:short-subunit dehydrogenase